MKPIALLLLTIAGCGGAVAAPQSPPAHTADPRIAKLETQVAELSEAVKRLAVKPTLPPVPATPPAPKIDEKALKNEAAAIIGRLSEHEQMQLRTALDKLAADTWTEVDAKRLSRITAGRLDPVLGEAALRKMAGKSSPGMDWAVKNLDSRQALRVWVERERIGELLDKFANGEQLPRMQLAALEETIGPHPAFDSRAADGVEVGLTEQLAEALKRSKQIETTE